MSAWKLVPVIPPRAMVKAGELHTIGTPHTMWKQMLSAYPDPTTDEALVERVARAIYEARKGVWDRADAIDRKDHRRYALAAIRAMEEKP